MNSSAFRILAGLVLGALLGAFAAPYAPWLVPYVAQPIGSLFLRLLLVLVMPLAAVALVLGVAELKPGALAGAAARALGWTVGLTGIAVVIGTTLVALVQPGVGVDRSALPAADKAPAPIEGSAVDTFVGMFPDNVFAAAAKGDLLGVLIVAVIVGLALRRTETPASERFREVIQGIFDVLASGVHMVMRLAPIGVAGLACAWVAKAGLGSLLPLLGFAGVVVGAISLQAFVVYPLALRSVGVSPVWFYRAIQPAIATAFSTSSSAATLPTTLEVAEANLHLPKDLARFVLTVGASANQNGTALFEGVAVIFLAQLYGVDLSFGQMLFIGAVAVGAGVGTAGVPGASMPVIAAIAGSVGVPPESVGVLLGIDRFLDMCRTALNVTGDLVIATLVSAGERGEGERAP
jgi:DAACS family dicarboxylate/amino acid:cation (Na+ or H+) symporter